MEHYHLFFGLDGDGTVHHFNTAKPGVYAGMLTVGPQRLLDFLELHLGLSGTAVPRQQRLLNLKKSLDKSCEDEAFLFSASYRHDPLGVTERLLSLWDSWHLSGWSMEIENMLPARMQMLIHYKRIFQEAGIGTADRIGKIMSTLDDHDTRLPALRISMIDDQAHYPFLFSELLSKLSTRVKIDKVEYQPNADPTSDLGKLQLILSGVKDRKDIEPFINDGSLQLLYFSDDINAATTIYTIMQKLTWKPLVINRDNGLLNGLALAHGKPVCDWHSTGGNGQVLQLFFLATSLFRRPLQSMQLQHFLSSPYLPFSRRLAKDLLLAFCKKPGINNAEWKQAIEDYLGGIKGKEGEKKKREQVSFWLQQQQHLHEKNYERDLLITIFERLAKWAEERAAFQSEDVILSIQLQQLLSICEDLLNCLQDETESIPIAKFERLQVRLFRQYAFAIADAQVGCYDSVSVPGSVWVPSDEIIWMNAIREENHSVDSKCWYEIEKEYFRKKGLPVADNSSAYTAYMDGVKRMVLSAENKLVIAMPASYQGRAAYEPYCIQEWNEMIDCKKVTTVMNSLDAYCPWKPSLNLMSVSPSIQLPEPKIYFTIPRQPYFRDSESYTSIEKLLQDPLVWFFTYILKLHHTAGLEIPETNQLMGTLADSVVQRLFTTNNTNSSWWKDEAQFTIRVFKELDDVLNSEGIPLLEHVNKRQLLEFKKALARNTACLRKVIVENTFDIAGTQVYVKGNIADQLFNGSIDLLLKKNNKHFIIDLKWTRSMNAFQQRLANGRDLQLVIYLALLKTASKAAYFLLNNGNLLIRAEESVFELKGPVQKVLSEDGSTSLTVLEKVINGFRFRLQELRDGKLESAYHDTLEILQPGYFIKQSIENLYPLEEYDKMKKPPYNNSLQLITGQIR